MDSRKNDMDDLDPDQIGIRCIYMQLGLQIRFTVGVKDRVSDRVRFKIRIRVVMLTWNLQYLHSLHHANITWF